MQLPVYLSLLATLALFTSCSNSLLPHAPAPAMTSAYSQESAARSRVLIHTGSISLEVADVEQSTAQVKSLVKKQQGYIEHTRSQGKEAGSSRLTVRVPQTHLTSTMEGLATVGKITSRQISVEDVTDEWIDLQAKIKNLRSLRDRLRRLLDRTNNVKEVLAVEKELNRVQSELDSLEGRMKAMQRNVSYSKITINLRQKSIPGPLGAITKGTWWGVKKLFVIRD
ncbi:DUF4349 domain-containing protein [Verrucomicrobiaceae bacterium 5K15]|uniref:DUF4349 domain-containing protein n=1 Tax=Oceaniferula flava TaxID=2800421 RepID=A0AAE2S9X9_9BACT|nr:DUF4349 domain-containing protein [Oceaniferula flavus]MBK1853432.1 DUF4349 domain-containing protein [Oceaniferula flavus]MBM1134737.1 DUF4349 domain-containing protein [Oceaniferula flavus]